MPTIDLKSRLQQGAVALNAWLSIPSSISAEVMAQAGWDSVTVDLQHGVQDYMSMVACFQGIAASPAVPLVRLPANEPSIVGKVLDAGARGVICPMIETAEETRALVAACRYPPAGRRSNGPIRAALYGTRPDYQAGADAANLCLPMIETAAALDQLDAILDVKGIDGVYVGPSDLSWALGKRPGLDREEADMLEIYRRIVDGTTRRGLIAGIQCGSPAYAARAVGMGFRLVTVMADTSLLLSAARGALDSVRGEAGLRPLAATPAAAGTR